MSGGYKPAAAPATDQTAPSNPPNQGSGGKPIGAAHIDEAAPAPAIDPALLMHGWMLEVLGCTVRGTIATFHQRGTVDAILIAICRAMGSLMGRIYGGDELEVMRFRRACRDAFKEAIKAEAVIGPAPKSSAQVAATD